MSMNAPAKRAHVGWRNLSVKIPRDHLNVYAMEDMSLILIPKNVSKDVKVSLKFSFEYCFTDRGLGDLNPISTISTLDHFLSYILGAHLCQAIKVNSNEIWTIFLVQNLF